jgi:oligopeptide/dipeptide ABC transporter ATP-binding protein
LPEGTFKAVEDVSFKLYTGEVLGVVGESGCGKSMTALALMGLVPEPGVVSEGMIQFEDQDLRRRSDREMQAIRGDRIAMIFQEPMTSLNPVFRVGRQISEALQLHRPIAQKDARQLALEAMKNVGIPAADKRFNEYPHQLSGGMRQRVMIAMAMCCRPVLLIADEPTTALDVTIQAQILDLMKTLVRESDMSVLFITHDLGIVAEMCDRVLVMYAGKIIESANVVDLFENPRHPYTSSLLRSIPKIDQKVDELATIPGTVPGLQELMPAGCRFEPRCSVAIGSCQADAPELRELDENHWVACHLCGE